MTPYDSVLAVTKLFLGPAAESFLLRQCQVALKTEPAKLTKAHFKDLAMSVEIAACRFIDRAKAESMAKKILALA
jgi:hypothetical protein